MGDVCEVTFKEGETGKCVVTEEKMRVVAIKQEEVETESEGEGDRKIGVAKVDREVKICVLASGRKWVSGQKRVNEESKDGVARGQKQDGRL